MMQFRGAIFDFNGTMFFDKEFQENSWLVFIEKKLNRKISRDEFNNYIHGRNMDVSLNYFYNKKFTPDEVNALEEEKESFTANYVCKTEKISNWLRA